MGPDGIPHWVHLLKIAEIAFYAVLLAEKEEKCDCDSRVFFFEFLNSSDKVWYFRFQISEEKILV